MGTPHSLKQVSSLFPSSRYCLKLLQPENLVYKENIHAKVLESVIIECLKIIHALFLNSSIYTIVWVYTNDTCKTFNMYK